MWILLLYNKLKIAQTINCILCLAEVEEIIPSGWSSSTFKLIKCTLQNKLSLASALTVNSSSLLDLGDKVLCNVHKSVPHGLTSAAAPRRVQQPVWQRSHHCLLFSLLALSYLIFAFNLCDLSGWFSSW